MMLLEIRPLIEKHKLRSFSSKFRKIRGKKHKVPHITLFYHFRLYESPLRFMEKVKEVCRDYFPISLIYHGSSIRKGVNGYVYGIEIHSKKLKEFREKLYSKIKNEILESPKGK
ncbi:MAG: 2'-5' RNA ligase family protein, partial [Candidatus Aenigmarchaeota archaeon]|nr:2'-5' RNA ligase family protein [Candidatus Aenigmarchaeota archaeon]